MWNKTKSLILSRIMTTAATIIVLLMTFFVPAISEWYNDISEAINWLGCQDKNFENYNVPDNVIFLDFEPEAILRV